MTVISLPGGLSPSLVDASFDLVRADERLEMFGGQSKITTFTKAAWLFSFRLPGMNGHKFRHWKAVLAQLTTLSNTFYISPMEGGKPSTGYAGINPVVNGASQLGLTLNCDTLANNIAVADVGDYITVPTTAGPELKILTLPANTNGSGQVTFTFEPPLKQSPADTAEIVVVGAYGEFGLEQARAGWSVDAQLTGRMQIKAVEHIV